MTDTTPTTRRYVPLHNFVSIEPVPEEQGLILTPEPTSLWVKGTVIAVGPGTYEGGCFVPALRYPGDPESDGVAPGDVVLFNRHAAIPMTIGDRKFIITKVDQLLGRIVDGPAPPASDVP